VCSIHSDYVPAEKINPASEREAVTLHSLHWWGLSLLTYSAVLHSPVKALFLLYILTEGWKRQYRAGKGYLYKFWWSTLRRVSIRLQLFNAVPADWPELRSLTYLHSDRSLLWSREKREREKRPSVCEKYSKIEKRSWNDWRENGHILHSWALQISEERRV